MLDLDQHQVAFDVVVRADVVDADDGDDLFELLADLLQHAVVADDDERHPRETGVFGFADGEAIDVVAARGEHAGHVGQHAGDVLHGGREDVTHGRGGRGSGVGGQGKQTRAAAHPLSKIRETSMISGGDRARNGRKLLALRVFASDRHATGGGGSGKLAARGKLARLRTAHHKTMATECGDALVSPSRRKRARESIRTPCTRVSCSPR